MARKDVDLVIRAKDEAENVVKSITKALNGFIDAQNGLQENAEGTEGALRGLGSAVAALDKAISGLDVGNKLSSDMDKAAGAVARLEKQVASSQGEFAQLERRVKNAETTTGRYQQKLDGARAAQERQTAAVAKAKKESHDLAAAYEQSVGAVGKLTARFDQLPARIIKTQDAFDKASARVADLREQMAGTTEPTKTLVGQLAAAERNLSSQTEKLAKLRGEYAAVESELRAASSAVTLFAGQSANAAADLARQETILGKITGNVSDLGVRARTAAGDQGRLESALDKTSNALARQQEQLGRAEGAYVDLAEAAGRYDAALASTANVSRGNLDQQLVDQGIAVSKAREELQRLQRVSEDYAAMMLKAGPPTREVSQRIQFLGQSADEAQFKLMAQEEALQQMGQAYRDVTSDMTSVTQGQARFIAAQNQLGVAMQSVANDGFRVRQAIRDVHKEAATAADSVTRLSTATRGQADGSARGATETGRLAQAYRQLYGDTRKSLSYTQRLRGEVLSLITAYGGFYGVVQLLGAVVDAYQVLEAAQSRLGVALGGDVEQTAQEMDFLRRTANRLGVDLGTLATEYSKFAIATQGTALAGENTRKIFIAVAEAARVNRSTTAEMQGVFTALTQIVSKGAVQMEELRQQLGDRLPGALQIMADGLGVTTAELIKMMEAGEVTSEALVPFSEELSRRFGPGLGEALASTSVALGRLKNAAFQALVQFGEGGFIQAFTKLANGLTDLLKSADFGAFLGRASAAFAVLIDTLGVLVDNLDLVVAAGAAFLALKLTPFIVVLAAEIGKLPGLLASGALALRGFAAGTTAAATGAATAAAGLGRLTIAIRALMSSTGIGLLVTAVSAGIGFWATKADEASEALSEHKKTVDKVRDAYDAVGGSVEEWRKTLNDLTATEAQANLNRIESAVKSLEDTLDAAASGTEDFWTNFFGYNLRASVRNVPGELRDEIERLSTAFSNGDMPAEDFYKAVDDAVSSLGDGKAESTEFAERVIQAARALEDARDSADDARNVVRALGDDMDDAQDAFNDLGNSASDAGRSIEDIAEEKADKFKAAMDTMAEGVASVNRELEYISASEALNKLGQKAIENASNLDELAAAMARIKEAQDALDQKYVSDALSDTLVDRIVGVESGGDPGARNPNSTATGLGQFIESTWLRMFKQYFPDRAASMSDAAILALREQADISRQMVELYLRENAEHLKRAGQAVTDANLYLSHFLGPGGAAALLGSAPGTLANDVLSAGQINANASILDGKTREEVIAWAQRKVGISEQELAVAEQLQDSERDRAEEARKEAERRAEEAAKQREETAQRIDDNDFEIEQQRLRNAEQEKEAAIRAAIRDARADDPNITEEEIARIREQVGALYDLEHAQERANAAKERAKEAEEQVNLLLAERNALNDQFEIAKQAGDMELQEELRQKMTEINAELIAAIEHARELWGVVGGPEADTAIAKLDAAKASAEQFGNAAVKNYLDWTRVKDLLVNGLTNAFDKFAQAVANGEDAGKAARDAFLQFASDFLLQIAKMIVQQAIFNALQAAFGGTPFGAMIGFGAGHTGGTVGSSRVGSGNQTRQVNPAVFAGAMRYHVGGLIGLRPGEVPVIAKQGEEMLTRDDPRHVLNGGLAGGQVAPAKGGNTRVVNAFDGTSFLEEALKTRAGEEVILNYVSANRSAVRSALGV